MVSRKFVVIGAGAAGLTVARELALGGLDATVIDRGSAPGVATEASVGVLTAPRRGRSPLRRLQALAHAYYPSFVEKLESESGVSVQHAVTGSLHLARRPAPETKRRKQESVYGDAGIACRSIGAQELRHLVPGISCEFSGALHIPAEGSVDPPSLLRALRASCASLGVQFRPGCGAARLRLQGMPRLELPGGEVVCGAAFVVAAGAWSSEVVGAGGGTRGSGSPQAAAPRPEVRPIRGQALELQLRGPRSDGKRFPNLRFRPFGEGGAWDKDYHVISRGDGRIWVGSTVENVGFDAGTTRAGLRELQEAARQVFAGQLEDGVVRHWAGLRPQAMQRGGPYVGPLPGARDVWVHCGHYRSGILLSPLTARLLVHLMRGDEGAVGREGFDLEALRTFRVDRQG